MTEWATKLTLTYYKFSASAETLRLAAAIGKTPFTNKAIDHTEWKPPPGKEADPRYRLPVLEIEVKGREKQVIAQRDAILHYLGRRGGLYPADPLEGLQIEYMLESVSEALRPLEVSGDGAVTSLISEAPWTDEEFLRIRERIASDSESGLPHYLRFFEKALRENHENKESKWLVGTDVSIADLKLYQLVCWISGGIGDGDGPSLLKGIESCLIESYRLLLKHKHQIETLPEVMSWRAKYAPPYSVFEYRPPFEFRSLGRRSRLETHASPMHPAAGRLSITSTGGPRGNSNTSIPRMTLAYFDTPGRAEPIRLAAAMGKVPFTNRSVSREDWADTKRFSPLKQLPTLIVVEPGKDLVTAPQSTAILRYIGKLGGLYPLDEIDAAQVEFMMETIARALRLLEMTMTGVVKTLILDVICDEEQKQQIHRRVLSDRKLGLPLFLNYFEGVLKSNNECGWLVGENVTIADLSLYHISSWLAGMVQGGVLDGKLCPLETPILQGFPLIKQHMQSIDNNPLVLQFREQYKPPYTTFNYVPCEDESVNAGKKTKDNLPRGVRRRTSSDGFPKNISRSKSSDQIPKAAMRHPGFSPPTPAKRRSSTEDETPQAATTRPGFSPPAPARRRSTLAGGDQEPQQETKKGDKMMSAPMRRQGSFDSVSVAGMSIATEKTDEEPRRKSRGASMPPRPRPASIIHFDDDDINFSDSDGSEDSADMNGSGSSFTGVEATTKSPTRMKRHEFWDDSSADSYDDESSSSSSLARDLKGFKKRVVPPLEEQKDASAERGPAPYNWKADRKRRIKKEKKQKAKGKGKAMPPKLPANTPRNQPHKTKSDAEPNKISVSETRGSTEQEETESKKVTASKESAEQGASKELKTHTPAIAIVPAEPTTISVDNPKDKEEVRVETKHEKKTHNPKGRKKKARLPEPTPRGKMKFPSNKSRRSTRSTQALERLTDKANAGDKAQLSLLRVSSRLDEIAKSDSFMLKKKRAVVIYFSFPGRAESIRLAAVLARLSFTNLAINPAEDDVAHKHMAPLGQFPVLEIEEAHNRRLTVPQSMAILRYLGMLGDLYPEDPLDALNVDSMCDSIGNALRLIEISCRSSSRSILEFKEFSDAECTEMRERIVKDEGGGIQGFLSFFERALENNFSRCGVWIAHRNLTIADLRLYQLLCWLSGSFGACLNGDQLDGMPSNLLKGFPLLELHKERVEEIPAVQSFRSQFSSPYSTFDFYPDDESVGDIDLEDKSCYSVTGTSDMPRLTLTHGKNTLDVEAIRLAAAIGKVQFTNKIIEPESSEWKNVYERRVKVSQLPLLEIEEPGADKKFAIQPLAILRYFCKLGNLYPSEPIRALEVESMMDTIAEIHNLQSILTDKSLQCFMSGSAWSENESWSVRRRIAKNKEHGIPFYFSYFEKAIAENAHSSWLVGSTLTIADLCLYNVLSLFVPGTGGKADGEEAGSNSHLDGLPENFLDDYPFLNGHRKDIEQLPAVVSFRSKFQPPHKTFTFRPVP